MSAAAALDLETVPSASAMASAYPEAERDAPGNYSKPESIAKWREADRIAWETERVKAYSVNPRLGRIVSLGVMVDGDPAPTVYVAEKASDERALLDFFWTVAAVNAPLVTWNGAFDLRFILVRSMLHCIMPTIAIADLKAWFHPYAQFPHFDVKRALVPDVKTRGEGLDEWAFFFGLPGKGGGHGSQVWAFYQAGDFDAIRDYNARDVLATMALYRKIRDYYFPQPEKV